ncbi:MAG: heavy metal-associated domain-containing protein [Crocinitomicaceae bacterium]|nr:heavy metal-associated domain-containing protein [Crocinitomicaceae bacterium]MDG1659244.1 heavy metal-associated domain-containing protein [Crocinitomicaceae bacterium]
MNLIIEVQNLKCEGCAGTITSKILALEGVEKVIVDVESSAVEVSIEEEAFSETVVTRLSELGYPVLEIIMELVKRLNPMSVVPLVR